MKTLTYSPPLVLGSTCFLTADTHKTDRPWSQVCAKDRRDIYRQDVAFGQQVLGFLAQVVRFFEGVGMHQGYSFQRHLLFEQGDQPVGGSFGGAYLFGGSEGQQRARN